MSLGERQTPNTGNTDRQHVSLQIDSRPKFNPIRNEDIHMRSSKDSSEEGKGCKTQELFTCLETFWGNVHVVGEKYIQVKKF